MNVHDHFVLLVQTFLVSGGCPIKVDHMAILGDAIAIDPVSLPKNVTDAARKFVYWKIYNGPKPDWLVEYEENIATHVAVEQLDGVDRWWRNAEYVIEGAPLPASWIKFVTGREKLVIMTKIEAEEFLKWAKEIEGWDDDIPPLAIHEKKS